jgi:hypothetical protein
MRAVVATESGVLEVNWMWLPTFLGMNATLKAELEKELVSKIQGRELNDSALDAAHDLVVTFLEKKFSAIHGMDSYLDALKYIYYT